LFCPTYRAKYVIGSLKKIMSWFLC